MKSVMTSIRPKYCELIASGKKTIEARKTRPKLETPFKCYVYATKQGRPLVYGSPVPHYVDENLVQTFGYSWEDAEYIFGTWNGKVIGEYVCDTYVIDKTFGHDDLFNGAACLSEKEASAYSNGKILFGWHISEFELYGDPKELGEFYKHCKWCTDEHECAIPPNYFNCFDSEVDLNPDGSINAYICRRKEPLTRPPQSWCYVEER